MLLSSGVIQGGVTSSVIPASNPGVQQCGGGSCPIPTETGTSVCNPYNWYYYGSEYGVKIISAQADKSEYRPGDVVTITGTVQLTRQDYYANECGEVGSVEPVADDAGKVKVAITGPYDGTINNAGGSLTGNVNLPTTAGASTVTYTVTATYSSASDQRDVSFDVIEFTPSLSVVMSQGSFVYPGETITVSGSGWAPDGTVTLDYGELGSAATVAVDDSGAFSAPALTVASDQSEGPYPIKGTESPNLESSGTATVQWRQLKLTLSVSLPSVPQGSSVTLSGAVTDNEGKPVPGTTVSLSGGGLPEPSPTTISTDSSGSFNGIIIAVTDKVDPHAYTISATAQKTPGYKAASASAGLVVTCPPYALDSSCPLPVTTTTAAAASAVTTIAGAAAGAASSGEDKTPKPSSKKYIRFRIRDLPNANAGAIIWAGQLARVELEGYEDTIGEYGDWDVAKRRTLTLWGAGLTAGLEGGLPFGFPLWGGDWQEFTTTKVNSLDDFTGFGSTTQIFNGSVILGGNGPWSVTFSNAQTIHFGSGASVGAQFGLMFAQTGWGVWR